MAPGMFDLANFVIYRKPITYHKGLDIKDDRFTLGRGIGSWAQTLHSKGLNSKQKFPPIKACPAGTLNPFAVNVRKEFCYINPAVHPRETANVHLMLRYINSVFSSVPDLTLHKILLVVPYLEQQNLYRKIKLTDPFWAELHISTANKAQGAEDEFLCYDGTAAANMGGKVGFYADFHRLAVILSRQRDGILLMMDFDAAIQTRKTKDPLPEAEQGVIAEEDHGIPQEVDQTHDVQYLHRMFQYFRDTGRVIEENVNNLADVMLPQITAKTYESHKAKKYGVNTISFNHVFSKAQDEPANRSSSDWDTAPAKSTKESSWDTATSSSDNWENASLAANKEFVRVEVSGTVSSVQLPASQADMDLPAANPSEEQESTEESTWDTASSSSNNWENASLAANKAFIQEEIARTDYSVQLPTPSFNHQPSQAEMGLLNQLQSLPGETPRQVPSYQSQSTPQHSSNVTSNAFTQSTELFRCRSCNVTLISR
ncbi:hypothetical protein ONS95_004091 [Cadophora gregata]|uniref:uncharacterized protein n=1 Tax=Cadophora gregata TaxID=51156 RepID=UPI0026DB0DA5|nr:uncharacterized protein ONS95_004091 [Cadophora gregata]KAK0105551.1 hypothetical protein ONS96_004936 [Cadophora gregata f. sp. sojae]KAK0105558.1 hypothetical protein ONS95_004091 [Cadophora gregata]